MPRGVIVIACVILIAAVSYTHLLEEAKKSLPENRVEVEVVDDNPESTQMIACKDYELGVSDYQEINANTTEATVTIVTTLSLIHI